MAQWQAVGFSHGVMNTDNMSILGLTLDYGPFGFLDAFDPGYICNHSDSGGRYAFDQQPDVAAWNITKLAQALVPLMSVETASQAIAEYPQVFGRAYLERMAAKFGLPPGSETANLVMDALQLLAQNRVDYTIFLRRLSDFDSHDGAANAPLRDLFLDRASFDAWAARYAAALRQSGSIDAERGTLMKRVNPSTFCAIISPRSPSAAPRTIATTARSIACTSCWQGRSTNNRSMTPTPPNPLTGRGRLR
jgi:serine/tyrosine/threonine adenylyltransferase